MTFVSWAQNTITISPHQGLGCIHLTLTEPHNGRNIVHRDALFNILGKHKSLFDHEEKVQAKIKRMKTKGTDVQRGKYLFK